MIKYLKNFIIQLSRNDIIITGSIIVYFCIKFLTINSK